MDGEYVLRFTIILVVVAVFCMVILGSYYTIMQMRAETTEIYARAEAIKASGNFPMAYIKPVK